MKYVLIAYILGVNICTYALYAADKRRARLRMWRVPEWELLLFSALGGSLGALFAIHGLHHKTKKGKFIFLVPTFFVLDCAVFAYIFWRIL